MTSNPQKAATLLQNLPDVEATTLRAQLSLQQQDRLLQATAAASMLGNKQQDEVLQEFLQRTDAEEPAVPPENELPPAATADSNADPEAATLPEDLLFQFFHGLPAATMFSLIPEESPQTIAVILSHLPTQQSVAVLDHFDAEIRATIVHQISKLQPVDLQTLVQIAEILQRRLERLQNHLSPLAEL